MDNRLRISERSIKALKEILPVALKELNKNEQVEYAINDYIALKSCSTTTTLGQQYNPVDFSDSYLNEDYTYNQFAEGTP